MTSKLRIRLIRVDNDEFELFDDTPCQLELRSEDTCEDMKRKLRWTVSTIGSHIFNIHILKIRTPIPLSPESDKGVNGEPPSQSAEGPITAAATNAQAGAERNSTPTLDTILNGLKGKNPAGWELDLTSPYVWPLQRADMLKDFFKDDKRSLQAIVVHTLTAR